MAVPIQLGMKELLNTLKSRGVQHPAFDQHIERYKKLREAGRSHKEATAAVLTKAGINRVAGPLSVKNDVAPVTGTRSDHIAGTFGQDRELSPIVTSAPTAAEPQATLVQVPESGEGGKRRRR